MAKRHDTSRMSTDVQQSRALSDLVAEEVRVLLTRRRMSGRELARRLDVSASWVSYRLTGQQSIDLDDLQKIASVLGVAVVDLLPKESGAVTERYLPGERVIATVDAQKTHKPTNPVRRPSIRRRPIDTGSRRPVTPVAV